MAKKLTSAKAKEILHDKSVHGHPLTDKQRRFFGAIAGGAKPYKAEEGGWLDKYEQGGLVLKQKTHDNFGKKANANNSDVSLPPGFKGLAYNLKGRNYSPAWGGQFQDGGYVDSVLNANKHLDWVQRLYEKNTPSIQIPGQKGRSTHFMESGNSRVYPTVVKMPGGKLKYLGKDAYDYADKTKTYIQFPSDKQAQWFGENYKKGTGVLKEFQTGGNLMPAMAGAVQTVPMAQLGDSVKPIPMQLAMGGSLPGAVGFTYARVAGSAPANGKYTKKTKASAQNGKEMKFYQEGLDFKPKTISQDGVAIDPMGYWNPDNVGNPVIIPSTDITMQGVDQPLIGISDTGDVQYMQPGEDYSFDGENVLELPVAKRGVSVNMADQYPIEKLDQSLNFTNYNKPTKGGWLDKYN